MRTGVLILTVGVSLALAARGQAQFNLAGARQTPRFEVVDTSSALRPNIQMPPLTRTGPPVKSSFNIGSMFRNIFALGGSAARPSAPIQATNKNKFQPNPIPNANPFPTQPTGRSIFDSAYKPVSR